MKKVKVNLATTLLTGSLLLTMTGIEGKVEAAELVISKGVDVYVNDTYFVPTDVNGNEIRPFIYNGSTYLPVRAVGEAYGVEIGWDGRVLISGEANKDVKIPETNKTKIARTDVKVDAVTDVEILVNGNKFVPKDANGNEVPVILTNGTTYLPVRAISNLYGIDINWDSKTGNVYIGKHEEKNYDIKLDQDSSGKWILPDTHEEKVALAGQCFEMLGYYTELLKPYSNDALKIKAKYDELLSYQTQKIGDLYMVFEDEYDAIALNEASENKAIRNELVEARNSLDSIAYADMNYRSMASAYKTIEGYETDFIFYEFYISAIMAKDAYDNLDELLKGITDAEYQEYKTRIDNAAANLRQAVNGKTYTISY